MPEASSSDYIALYNEIRNFENNLRSFIKCKLQQSWGKGWLEQLKNVLPNEYKEWESRAEKDKLAKENKELIEYMDFSDYIRIFDKFDKIFTHNAEEKSEILALLKNIKDIRDHTMHFRSGITRDDIGFIRVAIRKLKILLNIDECKTEAEITVESKKAVNPLGSLKNMIEPLGLLPHLEEVQDLLLKAYVAYGIGKNLPVLEAHQSYSEKLIEKHLEPKDAVEVLKQLGLAKESESIGRLYERRYYTITLTEDGVRLAQQISSYLVAKNNQEIDRIIKDRNVMPAFLTAVDHILNNRDLFAECVSQMPSELPILIKLILESKTIQTQLNYFLREFKKLNLAYDITVFDYQKREISEIAMLPELVVSVWQKTFKEAEAVLYGEFLEKAASIKILSELPKKQKSLEALLDEYAKNLDKGKVLELIKKVANEAHEEGATSKFSENPPYLLVIKRNRFEHFINEKVADLKYDILDYF